MTTAHPYADAHEQQPPQAAIHSSPPPFTSLQSRTTSPELECLEPTIAPPDVFKTELCPRFLNGFCGYGLRCQFAHGTHELRIRPRPAGYKTEMCRNILQKGYCKYRSRCCFRHNDDPPVERKNGMTQMTQQIQPTMACAGAASGLPAVNSDGSTCAPVGMPAAHMPPSAVTMPTYPTTSFPQPAAKREEGMMMRMQLATMNPNLFCQPPLPPGSLPESLVNVMRKRPTKCGPAFGQQHGCMAPEVAFHSSIPSIAVQQDVHFNRADEPSVLAENALLNNSQAREALTALSALSGSPHPTAHLLEQWAPALQASSAPMGVGSGVNEALLAGEVGEFSIPLLWSRLGRPSMSSSLTQSPLQQQDLGYDRVEGHIDSLIHAVQWEGCGGLKNLEVDGLALYASTSLGTSSTPLPPPSLLRPKVLKTDLNSTTHILAPSTSQSLGSSHALGSLITNPKAPVPKFEASAHPPSLPCCGYPQFFPTCLSASNTLEPPSCARGSNEPSTHRVLFDSPIRLAQSGLIPRESRRDTPPDIFLSNDERKDPQTALYYSSIACDTTSSSSSSPPSINGLCMRRDINSSHNRVARDDSLPSVDRSSRLAAAAAGWVLN